MARGDFVDAGKSKLANRDAYSGFWWRYANTSQEAINTNSDIIEIYPYIWKSNSITDAYTNNLYNSYIQVSFGSTTYNQTLKTKYNFGNVSLNTNYGLTSAFNSSNPFGYSAPSSITYITTTTKDGKTLYGARFTVQHNADGTSPSVTMKWHLEASATHGNAEKTITVTLDTIPRTSKPTCSNTTLGVSTRIKTNRVSNSFTHTLNIKIGDTTVEGPFNNIGEYKDWTPAISTYLPYIPLSSETATIECITFNGSTKIGTESTSCILTVPNNSDTKPTATVSITKGDSVVPSNWGVYVKGKSKLLVTIEGTAQTGTIPDTYSSTANGGSKSGKLTYSNNVYRATYTTSELTGSGTVTANVKDGRGFTSDNATVNYIVENYTNPQITTNTVARCDENGVLKDDGTYVKWSFQGSISNVNNKNDKSFLLKYAEKGTDNWTTIYTYNSNYTLPNDATTIDVKYPSSGSGTINNTKEYIFRFEATDTFTTTPKEVEIGTGADLMNFNASGTSMAIGGVSQRSSNEEYLDVYTNAKFYGTIEGDVSGNASTATTATTASKLGSSNVGSSDRPIYLSSGTATQCNTPASGNWFRGVPYVYSGGVMEVGRYIDFHPTNSSTLDYSKRIDAGTGTTARTLTLPDKTGTLACTSDLPQYTSGSVTATKSSGNGNITSFTYKKYGKVVTLHIVFNTTGGSTSAGSNIWSGTISGVDLPYERTTGAGYYGKEVFIGGLYGTSEGTNSGRLDIRAAAVSVAQTGSTEYHYFTMTYIIP